MWQGCRNKIHGKPHHVREKENSRTGPCPSPLFYGKLIDGQEKGQQKADILQRRGVEIASSLDIYGRSLLQRRLKTSMKLSVAVAQLHSMMLRVEASLWALSAVSFGDPMFWVLLILSLDRVSSALLVFEPILCCDVLMCEHGRRWQLVEISIRNSFL